MKYTQLIHEAYVNAIGDSPTSLAIKNKYKDAVWDMLQRSYAGVGGLQVSGLATKDDMLKLPMWKIALRNHKPIAVRLYKDKAGRKYVALGSDGSAEAMKLVNDIMRNEIHRSYGEHSKASLGKIMKLIPWELLQPYIHSADSVSKILPDREIIPVASLGVDELPADAITSLTKYPQLIDYAYIRRVNGIPMFKVMIGTPGKQFY